MEGKENMFNKKQQESLNGISDAFTKFAKQAPGMIDTIKANLSGDDLKKVDQVMKDNGLEEKLTDLNAAMYELNKMTGS